jgi:protein-disulfide isomerase
MEEQKARKRRFVFLAAALSVALVAVIALIAVSRDSGGSSSSLPAVVAAAPLDTSIPRNGRVLGDPNAPVTLVEWADYQCPFCGAFNQQIMPQLIEEYVKTGKVKVEFRDLPFLDATSGYGESDMAAEAAASAGDQGKFWEYHDLLFANQHGENQGAFSADRLKELAILAGLDMTKFNAAFDARAHQAEIQSMQDEAVNSGVTSTPTIVINGKTVKYTGQYEDLKADIETALAGA